LFHLRLGQAFFPTKASNDSLDGALIEEVVVILSRDDVLQEARVFILSPEVLFFFLAGHILPLVLL